MILCHRRITNRDGDAFGREELWFSCRHDRATIESACARSFPILGLPKPPSYSGSSHGLKRTFWRSEWHFAELALSGNDSLLEASRHTLWIPHCAPATPKTLLLLLHACLRALALLFLCTEHSFTSYLWIGFLLFFWSLLLFHLLPGEIPQHLSLSCQLSSTLPVPSLLA